MTTDTKLADLPAKFRARAARLRGQTAGADLVADEREECAKDIEAALARQDAQAIPEGLEDRIEAAIKRIVDGHATRRIPADPTDVDLVLAEVLALIRGSWPPFWIKPQPEQQGAVDSRFPNGLVDAIAYADEMEMAAAELLEQVIGCETDGSETGTDMLRRVSRALAARQPQTDEQYADEQALIDHLDSLMDDGGQGGDKWEPAQAAIRGIIAARQPVGQDNSAIRLAGAQLSNCAFNLAQRDHLTDPERRSLDESRKAWDAAIRATPPAQVDDDWHLRGYAYASKQATACAGCGEHKHTPLRIDAMGGYVCLTCIDQKLGSLLGEFGYPPAQVDLEQFRCAVVTWRNMGEAVHSPEQMEEANRILALIDQQAGGAK